MIKLSESALVPKLFKSQFSNLNKVKSAVTKVNKDPHLDFHPTPKHNLPVHPLVGYKEDATRAIVPFKRGLKGKPMNEISGFHKKVEAPEPRIVKEPTPTHQTTDKVDNYHKQEPTMATYRKIKGAIKQVA